MKRSDQVDLQTSFRLHRLLLQWSAKEKAHQRSKGRNRFLQLQTDLEGKHLDLWTWCFKIFSPRWFSKPLLLEPKPTKSCPNFLFPKTTTFLAHTATILNYIYWILPSDLIRSLTDFTEIRSLKKYASELWIPYKEQIFTCNF